MAEGAVLQDDQHKTAVFCMKFGNAQHSSCLAGQYLSKVTAWYEGALVFGLVACQELHTK